MMVPRLLYPETPAQVLPLPTADNPSGIAVSGGEYLPVVDENGIVKARATREWIHSGEKLLHPVVHMHVVDRFGRMWLQRRSAAKKGWPLLWDFAVGGHVSYGEQPLEALFREAAEEVGLSDFNPMCIDSYIWEADTQRELIFSYAAVGSFSLIPDEVEVEEVRLWTAGEIEDVLGKGLLTPSFELEFSRTGKILQTLL